MNINNLAKSNDDNFITIITDICKILNYDINSVNIDKIINHITSSFGILSVTDKNNIYKLIKLLPPEINTYVQEIIADGKLDLNDLEPLYKLISYLVTHYNGFKEINNMDSNVVILLIKIIIIIIVSNFGNIEEYLQIINLAFNCLSMVVGYVKVITKGLCCN